MRFARATFLTAFVCSFFLPLTAQVLRRSPVANSGVLAPPLSGIAAPMPATANEPVTGGVQPASAPNDHAAAVYLLERARQNSLTHNPGMQPFHFAASFTAAGTSTETGSGELTEIWRNGQSWRWTATLGNTSLVRVSSRGQLFESNHAATLPMRAHMLRNEIFWATEGYTARAQLRTSKIQWNGREATCVLASGVTGPATQATGRLWQEEEYCIDNASGLLMIHSVAPGTYAIFGYNTNQQFHGRTLPDRITIYVNGSLADEALFRIADLAPQDEAALVPGPEMTATPRPVPIEGPVRRPLAGSQQNLAGGGAVQSVMVHAQVNAQGHVTSEELSATGDPSLTRAALDLVEKTEFGFIGAQRQMYLNVVFGR